MDSGVVGFLPVLLKEEPVGALLAIVAAALLFGSRFNGSQKQLDWFQNILQSAAASALFLGLILGGHVLAKSNINSFNDLYQSFTHQGSLSWTKWAKVARAWPGWITQEELVINHFVKTETIVTLPANDPSKPALYETGIIRQQIPQNSIVGFQGDVRLTLERDKNPDGFNGFQARAEFSYNVVNQSAQNVETDFLFPLDTTRITYENIRVAIDGQDVNTLTASLVGLQWQINMTPRQKINVHISYDARGLDGYAYSVPESREIRDFILTISSSSSNVFASISPPGETIAYETRIMPDGSFYSTAKIDQIVAAPAMAVYYVQTANPYAPQDDSLRILRFMPRAFIFLAVIFALTLLIAGVPVSLRDVVVIQTLSWAHLPIFMLATLKTENLEASLLGSAAVIVLSAYFALRHLPRLPLTLTLAWAFILMGGYPFSGQKIETYPNNPYDSFVLIGMFVFMFSYALFKRIAGSAGKNADRA
jgi:hypothetical protein